MVEDKGNGDKAKDVLKRCPFLDVWCDKEHQKTCAIHTEITQNVGGVLRKSTLCGFNAIGLILSEINTKTQVPQQRINLPRGLMPG